MRIYFSGIGGVGIGPLAEVARDAGYDVIGSDLAASLVTTQLANSGVKTYICEQSGEELRAEHAMHPIDYFVYTAALWTSELEVARELGIPTLKRDGLLARIIAEKNLSLIAVAGTHGKTSTAGLLVWCLKQLGIPVSYSIGTTLSFGPSGAFDADSKYFVYECDEYDRNFLHFTPVFSLITSLDYDHPDTYPTKESYIQAFEAFIDQSSRTLIWRKDFEALGEPDFSSDVTVLEPNMSLDHLRLAGLHLRQNAFLVERALKQLMPQVEYHQLIDAINTFPGTDRRMERLADNLYTDYGHHPAEIAATLQAAHEINPHVVLVYQPHQNVRQHEIRDDYTDTVFVNADEVYWLPTYLSRENPELETLTPEQLTHHMQRAHLEFVEMDNQLWDIVTHHREQGHLVLCMGAGSIDSWLRNQLTK